MSVTHLLRIQKNQQNIIIQLIVHFQYARTNFSSNVLTLQQGAVNNNIETSNSICEKVQILCRQGLLKEALDVLHVTDQKHLRLSTCTYTSLLQECLNKKSWADAKRVHAHISQTRFGTDLNLGNKLVVLYAQLGSVQDARHVLDKMQVKNVASWTSLIQAYSKHGNDGEALSMFCEMQGNGIQPDHFTFASVLPVCANLKAIEEGKQMHGHIIRRGFQSEVFVGSALVDMYAKCGCIEIARQVFDKMPQRNVVSWTAMVSGYTQIGDMGKAMEFFQKMPEKNVYSWSVMVTGYAHAGCIEDALELFQKMPNRNVVSWNAIIAGYAQSGKFDEALKLFREMQLRNVRANLVTFASVLPACANLAALCKGMEIHGSVVRSRLPFDVFVWNTLIDMYAKCGSIKHAWQLFDKMTMRNVVSWTAMIVGYAMHGFGKEALQIFQEMQHSGTKPNKITFVGVLCACCHAGLVDDGWKYFKCMTQDYNLIPSIEHYCCIVDLLGRAGHLVEAQDFINNMPIEPNAAIWGSLLGACRTHSNIELGEHVAKHLFELDPENDAHYVQLSNIYAEAAKWDGVASVRRLMKDRRVKKTPGCSSIEINNKVHAFVT
ncbi:pentatricopeptide repeat-containing protein At3g29230 [Cryptomeria japonica]|uniref:pentatricopeptide repeat-containing protein At3g29230 n=1 Tax=Cryptomeria japonica TaxID=3369 RepID=UPI0025ABB909|nr:pentatricopeptide repeat-containing protein At3g29230 [Cryptomeria japonica]